MMEAETIDLTDPLEDLLRQTGWTPEYLQDRLIRLSEENAKKVCGSTKHLRDMTLSDLLGDYKCSNPRSTNDVITEPIELSDDEVSEVTDNLANQVDPEIQEINEVRVIETNEDAYDSDYNEDDDDEFLEESAACDDFSVLKEKHVVENFNESFINNLDYTDSTEHISSDPNERNDLPVKIAKEKNEDAICIITDIETNASSLVNSSNNNRAISATAEDNVVQMSAESKKACITEDGQGNRENSDVHKKKLHEEEENQNISNNTHQEKENYVNPKFTFSRFLSCDNNTPSSASYKSAFSELDDSIHSNRSESDDNISSDLGFIVSGVQGGIDFIESSEKISDIVHEEPDTNNEDKMERNITNDLDRLLILKKNIFSNKMLISDNEDKHVEDATEPNFDRDSNIPSCIELKKFADQENTTIMASKPIDTSSNLDNDILSNQSSNNVHHSKLVDDVQEQLDIACQVDGSTNSNSIEVILDNDSDSNGNTLENNLPSSGKNEATQFFGDIMEADSSTSLLLKSLDEAIKTCDKNCQLRENFAQEHTECGKKEFDCTWDSLTNIGDVNREHQVDKIKNKDVILPEIVVNPSKDNQNLLINNSKLSLKESCSAIITRNNECWTIANIKSNSESGTNDLINTAIHNKTEIKNDSTNNSAYISEHSSQIWDQSKSFAETNSMTEEFKEIEITDDSANLIKDFNTSSQELDKIVNRKIKDKETFSSLNIGSNVLEVHCEINTDLDKVKAKQAFVNAQPSKNKEKLERNCNSPITQGGNIVNDDNKELLTKPTNCFKEGDTGIYIADKTNNSTQIQNSTDIDKVVESKSDKCGKSIDSLDFIESNISAQNSDSILHNPKVINNKNVNLDKDLNNLTLNEETDKIIDYKLRNNATKPIVLTTVNEIMKNETTDTYNKNKHLDLSHNEIASTDNNDGNSIVTSCALITEESSSIKFPPNANNTSLLMPQEKLLEKNTKLINSNSSENLLESEKVIPDMCGTSVCGNLDSFNKSHAKNKNLIGTKDYDNQASVIDDSEEDNTAEESSQEKFEEIRKNLKLQLTSLRNRKRMDILQDVKTNVVNIEFSKKSVSISEDLNSIKTFQELSANNEPIEKLIEPLHPVEHHSVSTYISKTVEAGNAIKKLEDVHVSNVPINQDAANLLTRISPTSESIIEIQDGNGSNLPNKQDLIPLISNSATTAQSESVVEKQEDEDIPNVLSEIRKIIRKQKAAPKTFLLKSTHNSKEANVQSIGNDSQQINLTKYQEKEEINAGDINITIEKNQDETLISTNSPDKATSSSVVNSPFVSNSLDEFLNDAKLNVSYTIPKSGAEEGLRQNYSDEPIMPPIVAEIKDEDNEKTTQEIKYKPKTLAEKRRLLEKSKQKEKKRAEKLKKVEASQKRSYVLFKDRKIFLKAKSMGKCIASIESSIPAPISEFSRQTTPKKPSLLTELYKKVSTPVKYRPGPLCKKHLLQTDYSNWSSKLQTLPKVILKIMPELGKPIHPNLLHILPQWDGEVTDHQIDFALSALVTKGEKKQNKIFKLNVSYENQQTQILTRKKILDKDIIQFESLARTKNHSSTEEDVAEVIEKLLNYVEIKEIAPTLLKYDKDFTTTDQDPLETEVPPFDNHVFVKRKSRFSKTDRELIRLNCKVVSVEVEDSEPERQCFKPYCKLGCVCKSLKCEKIIGLHCKKVNCIFGCSCPKEKDKIISIAEPTIRLPAGTDLLSTDTVNRIEGEAKRNLAKLEKEFTQTVILTNDKTIVVGFGNKPRRATKTPKKYIDFFDDEKSMNDSMEPKKETIVPIRECSIMLKNWDFSELVPYCLVHHLHECHCRGRSTLLPKISVENSKNETVELPKLKKEDKLVYPIENVAHILLDRNDLKKQYPSRTVEESFQDIIRKSATLQKNLNIESDFEETLYSVTGRPLRKRKKIYEADFVFDGDNSASLEKKTDQSLSDKVKTSFIDESAGCSRTSTISKKYYRKSRAFTNAALYDDFANNLTQADLLKALQQEKETNLSDCDYIKRTIIDERKKLLGDTEIEIHKKRRKQKIQVRNDENITIRTTELSIPKQARQLKAKSVFKGEIIVNDSEWLMKLGQNAKQSLEGYARILPWSALLSGFLSKSINVYCISDMPLKLLLNVGPKLSSDKILDVDIFGHKILTAPLKAKASWVISQSENVREIIKWLLSGTLPSRYKTTCLSFLLVETIAGQFEVRGLCTQGENKSDVQENQTDLLDEEEISDQVTEVRHKNMKNEIQSLFITKGKFRLRELVEDGCDDDHTDNLYMWVGLPEVYKVAKWRVVFLNNDFAYLYFKNIQYSIKYTDLAKLTEMAKNDMLTLVLKNLQIRRGYDHASFGIYITHNYLDRIFIGPYFIDYDEDEVETLRYINQQLVSSESFNKMTGNANYRCGHWMYERTYCHNSKVLKDTIDLTNEDSPLKRVKVSLKTIPPIPQQLNASISVPLAKTSVTTPQIISNSTKDEHIIYHNGMPIHIKNSKPRSPSEFNRFIITNIPHFGYLGAFQPDNSSALEVSWPFEKKVLQFENADNARDFLQERFNQLLQPVPETFKIQVIVLIQLDLKEHEPINSDFLSGHCICGYFGTYNFRTLSDAFCKENFNISKEEITKLFAKRAHAYIRRKIEELAEIVEIKKNDPVKFNVPTILDRAKKEIKLQETNRRTLISDIQEYELKVIDKMKKLYEIVNTLPSKEKTIESKIINEVLQIRPKRLGANEVVEIQDDDDSPPPTINANSDIIYNVDSNDISFVDQPTKKPLKRKRATKKKEPKQPKVVAPSTSDPCEGPSTSFSVIKPHTNNDLRDSIVKDVKPYKGKQRIVIVRAHQPVIQPPLETNDSRDIITIDEDTETIIIDDDIDTFTMNEDRETFTMNEDRETFTINEDIEDTNDIETLTLNKNIEMVTINDDTETINELSEYQFEEIKNLVDDDNVNHYIIEYEGSDPDFTEIIVSQPDTAENMDLSRATIIASVPPTSNTSCKNPITVSRVPLETQSSELLSNMLPSKTYSKNSKPCTITSIPSTLDSTNVGMEEKNRYTVTNSKELTGKIKLGLQKILKRTEENLLFHNENN